MHSMRETKDKAVVSARNELLYGDASHDATRLATVDADCCE